MPDSYPAILRVDRLEWVAGPPPEGDGARVDVIVPTRPTDALPVGITGGEILAILEELGPAGAFNDIDDPVAWQREQ